MKPIKNFEEKLDFKTIIVRGHNFDLRATETELWVIPVGNPKLTCKNSLCIQFDWGREEKRYCWAKLGSGDNFHSVGNWLPITPENFKKYDVFMDGWLIKRIEYIWWGMFFN